MTDMRPPGTLRLLWSHWRRPALRGIALVVLLSVGGALILTVLEAPLAPWLRSFGLWPTLTGDWHGEAVARDGRVAFVYFEIRGDVFSPDDQPRHDPDIYGSARWCDDSGAISDYRLSGDPDNWRGTRFHLSFRADAERQSAVSPSDLQGEWSGDEIRATGELVLHGRTATAKATRFSNQPDRLPIRYRLRRGTEQEFLAACDR